MTDEVRSYAWQRVAQGASPLAAMSGVDFFRGLADGSIPEQPITSTIGWTVATVEPGMLRLAFVPRPWLFHAAGLLHGGVIATLLDSAMSGAVLSTLAQGQGCTTTQLSVTPIRGIRLDDGPFTVEGRVTHAGKRIGVATGEVRDPHGRLFAQGSASCLIL